MLLLGEADPDDRHAEAREHVLEVTQLGDDVRAQIAGQGRRAADAQALVGRHDQLRLGRVAQVQGRLAHARGGGHALHGHPRVTGLAQDGGRGVEDRAVVLERAGTAAAAG